MKIIICGSISAADEILEVQKRLQNKGHEVEIPQGVKYKELRTIDSPVEEKAEMKIKHDLIRGYYEKIKLADIVLVVNPEKNGIQGYIGGNTLIEMAFAHVLNKKLYVLYDIPDLLYTSEILATQPLLLRSNLDDL